MRSRQRRWRTPRPHWKTEPGEIVLGERHGQLKQQPGLAQQSHNARHFGRDSDDVSSGGVSFVAPNETRQLTHRRRQLPLNQRRRQKPENWGQSQQQELATSQVLTAEYERLQAAHSRLCAGKSQPGHISRQRNTERACEQADKGKRRCRRQRCRARRTRELKRRSSTESY